MQPYAAITVATCFFCHIAVHLAFKEILGIYVFSNFRSSLCAVR